MNYKGYCLWASDIPNANAPHYIVIVSDTNLKQECLVVAISSIKYRADGTPKYYDKSCELSVDDIVDDNGNNVLTKPSFMRYEYSTAISSSELFMKQVFAKYTYKCKITNQLLQRIQKGAMISKDLPEVFHEFFEYF